MAEASHWPRTTVPDVWMCYRTNPAISSWNAPEIANRLAEFPFIVAFAYTDDVGVEHRWNFFDDGTWSHAITDPKIADATPITELGWYALKDGAMRLWQQDPATDRTIPFALQGKDGRDGAVMDGVKMKPAK